VGCPSRRRNGCDRYPAQTQTTTTLRLRGTQWVYHTTLAALSTIDVRADDTRRGKVITASKKPAATARWKRAERMRRPWRKSPPAMPQLSAIPDLAVAATLADHDLLSARLVRATTDLPRPVAARSLDQLARRIR